MVFLIIESGLSMWDLAARARSALERSALLLAATTTTPPGRSSCFGKRMDTWSCARLADWLIIHEGMMKACGHDLALVASDPSESTSSYKKERDSIAKLALASMYICRARISCSSTNAQGLAHVGIKGNMHSRGI